ncbi:zinc-binding dehydrogenase [Microbispora sp. NPDC046933]|uniref:zinc-binding dehydrogenase n=1 Tax=Microbispora sp. NPDC046933 TaxID=3155618 RepID=UPI0033E34F29
MHPADLQGGRHPGVQADHSRGDTHVTGTASAPKHEFLRALGADSCVDHRVEDFTDTEQRYDIVLDTLGGQTATRSVNVLCPGGVLVCLMPARRGHPRRGAEGTGPRRHPDRRARPGRYARHRRPRRPGQAPRDARSMPPATCRIPPTAARSPASSTRVSLCTR